jgi:hypothetical protein
MFIVAVFKDDLMIIPSKDLVIVRMGLKEDRSILMVF